MKPTKPQTTMRAIETNLIIPLVSLLFIFGLGIAACEGPAGPQGEQGLQGEQGPKGDQGDEGTANVIYSEWMNIEWNEMDEATNKIMDIEEPMITEDFIENGTVLVYIQGNNGLYYNSSFVVDNISVFHVMYPPINVIGIHAQSTDGAPINVSNFNQVRYVLIPGGVSAKMRPGFLEDYQAVKEYYGIPD